MRPTAVDIKGLIDALDAVGLEFGPEEVLDVLWLASRGVWLSLHREAGQGSNITSPPVAEPPPDIVTQHPTHPQEGTAQEPTEREQTPRVRPKPAGTDTPPRGTTKVYTYASPSSADRTVKAVPVGVPVGRALDDRLNLMRALRPLRQRRPSLHASELDEEGTVEVTAELRTAHSGQIYPVFRPQMVPWFDVDLIQEDDTAIELWGELLREFGRMLEDTGAFRAVRRWRLRLPPRQALTAEAPHIGMSFFDAALEAPTGARVPYRSLAGGARRLIMFASHGSSLHWLDGSYARLLADWSRHNGMMLLHLMPRERWPYTPLGEPHGLCTADAPGPIPATLRITPFWWRVPLENTASLLPLPATALEASELAGWAQMHMARGRQCAVFLLDSSRRPYAGRDISALVEPRDISRTIDALYEVSPMAFQLAVYLSTGPFTISVARLVQKTKLGSRAGLSELAEVFLSGLLIARPTKDGQDDPTTIYYEFKEEASAILRRSLRDAEARQIAEELRRHVSEQIAKAAGLPFTIRALVPREGGTYDIPTWARPFANVASSLLGLSDGSSPSEMDHFAEFGPLTEEMVTLLRLATWLGRATGAARRLPEGSPPAHWASLVAAMLVASDPASRMLQAVEREGWLDSQQFLGRLGPEERLDALRAAQTSWAAPCGRNGLFTPSARAQIHGATEMAREASVPLEPTHLLAGLAFQTTPGHDDDIRRATSNLNFRDWIGAWCADRWAVLPMGVRREVDTQVGNWLWDQNRADRDAYRVVSAAIDRNRNPQVAAPDLANGRGTWLVVLAEHLAVSGPRELADILHKYVPHLFRPSSAAEAGADPGTGHLRRPSEFGGGVTLVPRALLLARMTRRANVEPSSSNKIFFQLRHMVGAAIASNEILPPQVYRIPPAPAGAPLTDWDKFRHAFIAFVARHHADTDNLHAWTAYLHGKADADSGPSTKSRQESTFWLAGHAPSWANDWGHDDYAPWVSFSVIDPNGERITQRLRWCPPGRFLMGSPGGKEGRYDKEGPRHEVTLASGFWLFDTPCTQALWQAVMGNNPSRFVDPARPVEHVSFTDVQDFLGRVNSLLPGLNLILPSEAQWEYACRAGTETATWAGEMRILGVRNAPVLDAIAWYAGNSGVGFELDNGEDSSNWLEKQYEHTRAGTRRVGMKAANPWGLYDMLGNVWEWCADHWHRNYKGAPNDGSAWIETGRSAAARVRRGGSWGNGARNVRAADRFGRIPERRDNALGFRCARVQDSGESGLAEWKAGRGASPALR